MTRAAQGPGISKQSTQPESDRWIYAAAEGLAALRGQEWLLTNGLGGFAMGTASGVPTRRYHAMLIAATRPPVGRIAALNGMIERIEIGGRTLQFSSFEFNGRSEPVAHPDGYTRLKRFERDEAARWVYSAEGFELTRELVLFSGTNAAGLRYIVRRPAATSGPATLTVRPLVSLRDFHALIRRGWADNFRTEASPRAVKVERDGHRLHIGSADTGCTFIHDEQWWYDFFYREDADRGQECVEDLFSPGHFEIPLNPGAKLTTLELTISLGGDDAHPERSLAEEIVSIRARRASLARAATPSGAKPDLSATIRVLAASTDAFIVSRRNNRGGLAGISTIAGYPWFSDWGRDTFISLDGLLLATGQFEEARRELECFASAQRNGIIPNVFNDQTGEPEFNTVDASLWFVHAACRWFEATGDRAAFESVMQPACISVVEHYRRGTDFNIAMDPIDKLITAGTNATQLTWMDAQRDGVTFTPRHGKAVEINALWYNALRSLVAAIDTKSGTLAADLGDLAGAVARSLAGKFWNQQQQCLFDCLTPSESTLWAPDATIRPNQIFAVSLPHSALSLQQQRAVLECARSRLLTPMGVRTLDPADPRFRARYRGTLFDRDSAYHQGTAWPWLLGPVAEATLRAGEFSAAAKKAAMEVLAPVLRTIEPGTIRGRIGTCAGQIAEVYDGDGNQHEPQRAGGCPAQAWSIAEALRVLKLIAEESPLGIAGR
jgi:predicted glycogen debranching enzyme